MGLGAGFNAMQAGQAATTPSKLQIFLTELLPMLLAGGGGALAGGAEGAGAALTTAGQMGTRRRELADTLRLRREEMENEEGYRRRQMGLEGIREHRLNRMATEQKDVNRRLATVEEQREQRLSQPEPAEPVYIMDETTGAITPAQPGTPGAIPVSALSAAAANWREMHKPPEKPSQYEREIDLAYRNYSVKTGKPVGSFMPEDEVAAIKEFKESIVPDQKGGWLYMVFDPATGNVVWMPSEQAVGQAAARTVYSPEGVPSVGGQQGFSTTAPPTIPASAQEAFGNLNTVLEQIESVRPQLDQVRGRVFGDITLAEVNKLGGLGATPEQIRAVTALQRLVTTQAFQTGGKQLTITELEQFEKLSPQMTDTIEQAIIKLDELEKFTRSILVNRIRSLTPRQRGQVDPRLVPEEEQGGAGGDDADPLGIR